MFSIWYKYWWLYFKNSAANKGWSTVNYHQSVTFDRPYLHVMIIVTGGFSEKSFFIIIFTRSRTQMFFKTGVTRNFAIFTGKYLCWSLTACNFISTLSHKSLEHRWFLWKLRNFSENFFLWNTSSCCFCQFDKVTVQWWGSAKLLFLIYKTKYMGLFLLTRFIDPVSMLYTHYW